MSPTALYLNIVELHRSFVEKKVKQLLKQTIVLSKLIILSFYGLV